MFRKGLKMYFHGWVAGSIGTKAISASNLKLKLTEAELGNIWIQKDFGTGNLCYPKSNQNQNEFGVKKLSLKKKYSIKFKLGQMLMGQMSPRQFATHADGLIEFG